MSNIIEINVKKRNFELGIKLESLVNKMFFLIFFNIGKEEFKENCRII